jgi:hypothetical protein
MKMKKRELIRYIRKIIPKKTELDVVHVSYTKHNMNIGWSEDQKKK